MNVEYDFYVDEYLSGKEPSIDESLFPFYAKQADALIKEMTLGRSELYTEGDEVKMAICAAADALYTYEVKMEEAGTPVNVSSERVGEYSVSYANTGYAEQMTAKSDAGKTAAWIWLAPVGLLFRGV